MLDRIAALIAERDEAMREARRSYYLIAQENLANHRRAETAERALSAAAAGDFFTARRWFAALRASATKQEKADGGDPQ